MTDTIQERARRGDMLEIFRLAHERHPNDDAALFAFVREAVPFWLDPEGAAKGPIPSEPENEPKPSQSVASEPIPSAPDEGEKINAPADPFDLSPTEYKLWRALAVRISETGLSPSYAPFAQETGIGIMAMPRTIDALVKKGYIARSGNRRTTMLHIKKWPDGVRPRETEARQDGRGALKQKHAGVPRQPGKPNRRFDHAEFDPTRVMALAADHPAMVEKRTLFPTTVTAPADSPRLLISGANQRKLGDRVTKGPWSGMPIYALTLEERATCPDTCHMLGSCYGNGMQMARRHKHGPELIKALDAELALKQREHPDGFVVRLHVLGDFYSVEYVAAWAAWIKKYPALHVFGYTAWKPDTEIGAAVKNLRDARWDRFAIRFSGPDSREGGATTIARRERGRVPEGLVCPAQSEPGVSCGSCGLCWHPKMKAESIVFMMHGRRSANQPNIERGPNTCATPDCRFPKQPGRDHCAACLAKKMPERKRADMVEPLVGRGA